MCLGIPGRVVSIERNALGMTQGRVSFGGITKQVSLGEAPAISSARSMPWAVSIIAQSGRSRGAPASSRTDEAWRTLSALSTFGIKTASAPDVAAATRSACPQGVANPLTRTIFSRGP